MFNKGSKGRTSGPNGTAPTPIAPTIVSADMLIEGNLRTKGEIHVDGRIVGDVECSAVTITQDAKVDGHVVCENARIDGTMLGEIRAKSVIVSKTARIMGDVIHKKVTIEAGAHIEGSLRRIDHENPVRLPAPRKIEWTSGVEPLVDLDELTKEEEAELRAAKSV